MDYRGGRFARFRGQRCCTSNLMSGFKLDVRPPVRSDLGAGREKLLGLLARGSVWVSLV